LTLGDTVVFAFQGFNEVEAESTVDEAFEISSYLEVTDPYYGTAVWE